MFLSLRVYHDAVMGDMAVAVAMAMTMVGSIAMLSRWHNNGVLMRKTTIIPVQSNHFTLHSVLFM